MTALLWVPGGSYAAVVKVALAADGTEPRPAHRQDETEAGRG